VGGSSCNIAIAGATHGVVWQNIWLAFAVKAVVLALSAGGLTTLWEVVFHQHGRRLTRHPNALRIQRMDFITKP
jgi:Cd2+/Zn2+-exporting ATPase